MIKEELRKEIEKKQKEERRDSEIRKIAYSRILWEL